MTGPRRFARERARRPRAAAPETKARTTITASRYRAIMPLQAIVDVATRELASRLGALGLDVTERVSPAGPRRWPFRLDDLAWDAGEGDATSARDHEAFAREVIALVDDTQ